MSSLEVGIPPAGWYHGMCWCRRYLPSLHGEMLPCCMETLPCAWPLRRDFSSECECLAKGKRGLARGLASDEDSFLRAGVPAHKRPSVRREMSSQGKGFLPGTWPLRRKLSSDGDA